ncbi:MAG: RNA polymerase sigma factor [Spongiibacteraceae bacterium]
MDYESKDLRLRLKRYLNRFLKRPEDVEDITQESFLKVLEAGSKGKIHHPKAYLYRTARNLALNSKALKSNHVVNYVEDLLSPDVLAETTKLEDDLLAQQRFELFCRATAKLPEQCRKVIILCKVYGYSQKEVAQKLNINVGTVEKHVAKGMLRCSEYLENRGYMDKSPKSTEARR